MTANDIEIERNGTSFRVRIPVHAEEVSVQKLAIVYEEIDVRRELIEEIKPAESSS
jgi:stress response protein YsnF